MVSPSPRHACIILLHKLTFGHFIVDVSSHFTFFFSPSNFASIIKQFLAVQMSSVGFFYSLISLVSSGLSRKGFLDLVPSIVSAGLVSL